MNLDPREMQLNLVASQIEASRDTLASEGILISTKDFRAKVRDILVKNERVGIGGYSPNTAVRDVENDLRQASRQRILETVPGASAFSSRHIPVSGMTSSRRSGRGGRE